MVIKDLNPIETIGGHIKTGNNFVLNGGAGSGKTRSLIDVIDLLHNNDSTCKIACITFTNVAADEITKRVLDKSINLRASTIHDFLWDIIKHYQKNLKQTLLQLIQSGDIKYSGEEKLSDETFKSKSIEYREWVKLEDGTISHNEVLQLANKLFKESQLLRRIMSDKYDFILIDEYQDTEKQVIEIFLNYLQEEHKHPLIGLFGDSMQSIYDKGIGDLHEYISSGSIKEVPKVDNWRCAKSVITLINKIRNDGLQQKPAGKNLVGKITFLYSNADQINMKTIKKHKSFADFDFTKHSENKELYLTHKLIASQFGFVNLLNNYQYKQSLTGDNPDKLIKHLFQIQEIIFLYKGNKYNDFIRKTDYKILKNSDLKILKENIDLLKNHSSKTIEEVINLADKLKLVQKDDSLQSFILDHEEQYNKVKDLQYSEVVSLYEYRSEHSPYSTQHGVKGTEYDNVFVVLDNGNWNQYNFTYLFENREDKEAIITRTRKIFYVCCSRTKDNLIVYYHNPNQTVIDKAKEWFGKDNTISIS